MIQKYRIQVGIGIIMICVSLFVLFRWYYHSNQGKSDYGVFIGIDPSEMDTLNDYQTVVIDPSQFSKSDIEQLHQDGKMVYGYLNVGSLETFRPYFERFQSLTQSVYENWSDEYWVNVSSTEWQSFVIDELGKSYVAKGIDGFFVDNTDVYYQYPTDDIFQGVCSILQGLNKLKRNILINGGDVFVSKCIDENIADKLFDGINQECVFTCIDFTTQTYGPQEQKETERLQTYIYKAKEAGIDIYLLEYGADSFAQKTISRYCEKLGAKWYNADSLELR